MMFKKERKVWRKVVGLALTGLLIASVPSIPAYAWESSRVYYGTNGTLTYASDSEQNKIPDFSYAGYRNGEAPIPDVPVVKTISPVSGDNTSHIQAAINEVSNRTPDSNGFRGALQLTDGEYQVSGTLFVNTSGVVLIGGGDNSDPATNTILLRTGTSTTPVLVVGGNIDSNWSGEVANSRSNITTSFVPVGSRSFTVADASKYAVGDNIIIYHPSTQAWLNAVDGGGMDSDPDWGVGDVPILFNRYITGISGSTITIDAPVFNHLNRSLSQSYIYKYNRNQLVTNVGVENLQIDIQTQGSTSENHAEDALVFDTVEDGWIDNVTVKHFVKFGIVLRTASRITVQDSRAIFPHSQVTGGRRYNFGVERAQLILFKNNEANEGRHAYVGNGKALDSGIVFLNNQASGSYTSSEAHRLWGMGFLYDNHTELNIRQNGLRVIGLYNRGDYGSSHGWSAAHSVVWGGNVGTGSVLVQKPPTAQNYAIGVTGTVTGNGPFTNSAGFIEGTNQSQRSIPSLYRAQLAERLGTNYLVSEDTYIRGGTYANVNYGSSGNLNIKTNPSDELTRISFMKVNFTAYDKDDIGSAILHFYSTSTVSPAVPITVLGLTSDSWSESSVTWNNRPSTSGATTIGVVNLTSPGWYSIDVTDYIKSQSSDQIASFQLIDNSGSDQLFNIRSSEYSTVKPFLSISQN